MALVRVDASRLEKALIQLRDAIGGDARRMLDTEMSKLIEDLARATTKPNKQGKRINRDFHRAFRYDNSRGAAAIDIRELYKTLDSFGKYGARKPTKAAAVLAAQRDHQTKIGHLAAGWLGGGNPTGAQVPDAVKRQAVIGSFTKLDTIHRYVLTSTNNVGFLRHFKGMTIIIQKAINKRSSSIFHNLQLIKQGKKTYQFR